MSESGNSEQTEAREINPRTVTIFLLVVYFLAPYGVQITIESLGIEYTFTALLWTYFWNSMGPYGDPLWLSPIFLGSIPYTFFRIVFIVMIHRFYYGNTTKIRSFIIGIAGELQYPLLFLIAFLPSYPIWQEMGFFLLVLPVPILLVAAIIIVHLFPPVMAELWNDDSSDQSWWDQSYEYEEAPH